MIGAVSAEIRRLADEIDSPLHARQAFDLREIARDIERLGSKLNDAATQDVLSEFFTLDTATQSRVLGTLCGAARFVGVKLGAPAETAVAA